MYKKLMVAVAVLLLFSSSTWAVDFNIIGAGARARGMGGAFIGLADDATAVSWNPAGLIQLETPEASVVGMLESHSESADIPDWDTDPYSYSHFNLNFASAAIPLAVGNNNIVAAIAYQQMINLYYKYETDIYTEEQTGGVNAITPAVGVQLTPALSVGASLNIFTGKTNYTEDDQGYDQIESEEAYSGTNFNIGVMMDLNRASIGVVFKTPFDLKGEMSGDYGTSEYILKMPTMIGFGIAYTASEKLTLAFDYESRKFSNSEEERDGITQELQLEDINQVRVGMEYLMMSGKSIVPLRLGFATAPTPNTDSNGDQITGVNLTAGIGIIMGNLNLDLGAEFNTYSYEYQYSSTTYDYSDNYFRFIVAGVIHFNQ
ncbi:hypothetical protein JW960_11375 [candidate division KSB1 bacterium]|nr:hypothetical protein [candidate division KSB1 bacterium]